MKNLVPVGDCGDERDSVSVRAKHEVECKKPWFPGVAPGSSADRMCLSEAGQPLCTRVPVTAVR